MIIWGTFIAIVAIVGGAVLLGPYGIVVLLAVVFGMVLSTYIRTKEIHTDVQMIKEKLGIADEGEAAVSNEEIEAELEAQLLNGQGKTLE